MVVGLACFGTCVFSVCTGGCENETLVSQFLSLVVLFWFGNILVILG